MMESNSQTETPKVDQATVNSSLVDRFDPSVFDVRTLDFLARHPSGTVRRGLTLFQEFYQKSIWDFLVAVDRDLRRDIENREYLYRRILQQFVCFLEKEGAKETRKRKWTGKTISCYLGDVQAYLSFNGVKISVKKEIRLPADHVTYEKHAWTLFEFANFVSTMKHVKYQAAVTCLFQGGLSCGDLLARKYGDVRKELETDIIPLCLAPENRHLHRVKAVGRQSKHVEFLTFIGNTGVQLLKKYLATRKELRDDSPLFDFTQQALEDYVARHARKLYGDYEGMNPWRVHGMRDFFKKEALKSGLRSKEGECYVEYFSAHDLASDIGKRYNTMPREEWRAIYRICQPFLEFAF